MTVSSTTRRAGSYVGNGTNTQFPFYFKVFKPTDVLVLLADVAGSPNDITETALEQGAHYTVALNSDQENAPGGVVTVKGAPLAAGKVLNILSNALYEQPTDIQNQGGFYPQTIEDALDRSAIQIQQLAEILSRAVKLPVADPRTSQVFLAEFFQSVRKAVNAASDASASVSAAEGHRISAWNAANAAAESANYAEIAAAKSEAEADRAEAEADRAQGIANQFDNLDAAIGLASAYAGVALQASVNAKASEDAAQGYAQQSEASVNTAINNADLAIANAESAGQAAQEASESKDAAQEARDAAKETLDEAKELAETMADALKQAQTILEEIKALKEGKGEKELPEPFGIGSYIFASVRYWDGYNDYYGGDYDDDVYPGEIFDGSQLRPAVLKYEEYWNEDGRDRTSIDRDDYDDWDEDWGESYLPGRWISMSFGRKDSKRRFQSGSRAGQVDYERHGLILFMRLPDEEDTDDEEDEDSDHENE